MENNNNNNDGYYVPEEIIVKILLRLNVKTLLRLKCVCKKWYALIQNQSFISNHFNYQRNHLVAYIYEYDIENKYVESLLMDETLLRYEQPHHLQLVTLDLSFIPSCHSDGIFCVVNKNEELGLWNPANREFRALPISRPDIPPCYTSFTHTVGFGFEPLTSDLKLVWFQTFFYYKYHADVEEFYEEIYNAQIISVYTLSSDSWRYLDEDVLHPFVVSYDSSGISNTYLNGFCYFPAMCEEYRAIVSFDLCKEVFKEIKLPEDILCYDIILYKSSIALISYGDIGFNIWLMNKNESWTKHITIEPHSNLRPNSGFLFNNKLIQCHMGRKCIAYDVDTEEIILLYEGDKWCCFTNYKESLISVKRKN